jgi:hypothetical protein
VQTAVWPARIVRVVVLPSPLSDALDTADALRDQYYAEDTFQSMLVGF